MKLRVLLLLSVLVAPCCATVAVHQVLTAPDTRTPEEQFLGTARVDEVCLEHGERHLYAGSGVIISEYRVLTAAHVVGCDDGELVSVTVDAGDGPQDAEVEVLLPELDVARLWVRQSMANYLTPLSLGPRPVVGDRACEAAVMPVPTYGCGPVQPSDPDEVRVRLEAEHGNSGAGLYVRGQLVGIVVRQRLCEGGVPCVGVAAPLQDYPWLLEF